jgi:energy-coupling factor transporter ATP-binding protein EcfA2
MNTIATKLESLLAWIRPSSSNDENVIDLQKTFSAAGIDILPVVIKMLELEAGFPSARIQSKEGIKYHELEFFQSNLSSSSHTPTPTPTPTNTHTPITSTPEISNSPEKNRPQESLFNQLDRTHTILGSTLLKSMILQPYHTQDQIRNIVMNRQSIIKSQADNPNAMRQIRTVILGIQPIEKELLAMSLEDTAEMLEVYKIIFFELGPLKYLNYQSVFLKIFYYFMIIFSPLYGLIAPFVFLFAPFLFMKYIMKIPIPLDTFWTITKKMILGGTGIMGMLDKMFSSQLGAGMQSSLNGDGLSIKGVVFWLVRMAISILNSSVGSYLYIGFIAVSYFYSIYNSFQVSITFNKIINMFHSRMNILAKWIRMCMNLYNARVCFESNELQGNTLTAIHKLKQDELVQMLLTESVFMKEPSLISDKGVIIKAFKLFLDSKKQSRDIIKPFAQYVAHVDVMTALATWLLEKDDRCPAEFILDATHPTIQGTDIWNLACGDAVYNDVLLGGNNQLEDATSKLDEEITSYDDLNVANKTENNSNNAEKLLEAAESPEETMNGAMDGTETTDKTKDPVENNKETIEAIDDDNEEENGEANEDEDEDENGNEKKDLENNKEELEVDKTFQKSAIAMKPINNVLITGPNGSGKSTYIKSITECVILAQTVGVVPAREFRITPFRHISTYLNIPDCQGRESLFQAEMNRCYQQLETLSAAEKAGEFSFNIMDEIFVSTNYQEGMSGAYAVINQLCRFNKCLNVITTHFDKLANLEDLHVGRKYFDIDIMQDGQVVKDYKIRNGVSRKHMALRLLRSRGFSNELVQDAEGFYEKLLAE